MDPVSVFLGGLGLGFVNAIGPRLVQRFIPTPFDQAQIVSIETQRQRLLDEASRFERQLVEARSRLLDELQHRKDMIELQEQLRRWQFNFLPADFLKASGFAEGKALNIVLRMSDHRRKPAEERDPAAIILKDAVMAAEEQMLALYAGERLFPKQRQGIPQNGVLFYADYRLGRELPVQSAVTALSSLLASEPVILIDIAMRDGLRYRVTIAHWGDAMGDAPQPVILPPHTLDLSQIASSAPERAGPVLSLTLTSLLVALSDNFHLLRHMWAMPQPAMPALMRFVRATPDAGVNWNGLVPVYARTLDALASRTPAMATEMASELAMTTHAEGELVFANEMLGQATRHFAKAHRQSDSPQEQLDRIAASSLRQEHPAFFEALQKIAGLEPKAPGNMRSKAETYRLLAETRRRRG